MKRYISILILSTLFLSIDQPIKAYGKSLPKLTALFGSVLGWKYKDLVFYEKPPSYDTYGDIQVLNQPTFSYEKIDLNPPSILDKQFKYVVQETQRIARLNYCTSLVCRYIPWPKPYGSLKERLETRKMPIGSICIKSNFGSVLRHPPVEIEKFNISGPFSNDDEKQQVTTDLLKYVITHTGAMHRDTIICPKLLVRDAIVEEVLKNKGFFHLGTNYIKKGQTTEW